MSVHTTGVTRTLLDVAAEVLVADPSASLAEVALAAGIGRTTLHKHYATRDDLVRAVGHRAIDLWDAAIEAATVTGADSPDGGLLALVRAMVPIGPQLMFLWRTPAFDHVDDIARRWVEAEQRGRTILERAQARGVLSAAVPDWWLLQTCYSLIYVAAESVRSGHLAPRDAPELVLDTLLRGLGSPPPPKG
jgi:AcrR family transcriptional regulator